MAQDRKTIDDISRTLSSIAGTERIAGRDSDGDFKTLMSTISSYVENNITSGAISVPVGAVLDFYQEPGDTFTIPGQFAECNGAQLSDADSVWNNFRIPNLNGADVVLTLTWTADGGGSYATVSATDVTGLQQGDTVTGTGIASGARITDIAGTTVTISDTAASGSIESTFTNNGRFVKGGTSSGDGAADQFQGHEIIPSLSSPSRKFNATSAGTGSVSEYHTEFRTDLSGSGLTLVPYDDGTNGTPRTGSETAPIYTTAIKIMRIK